VACAAEVPSEGRTHQEIDFYASVETEDCVEDPEVRWAFGDGATSSGTIAQHEYQGTGSFDWSLVATADDAACTQAGTIFIEWGLPGDGDGDGAVSIGEVQQVVNMFLGTMPAGNGADCDGDGSISIGEVQKVINAFLGEPVTC